MKHATTVGLDLAKNVFQVHGIDASGEVVLRRKLRRVEVENFFRSQPPLTVGIEACGGAHHWARVIENFGHRVRLMPPAFVKPYVKRGKTDAADAEAICEAVGHAADDRASGPIPRRDVDEVDRRFVPAKTEAQQAAAVELKVRQTLVRQMTRTVNALCGHLAEFGIVAAKGIWKAVDLIGIVRNPDDRRLPPAAREALRELVGQVESLRQRIDRLDTTMVRRTRTDETARRLATNPGVGAIAASALQAMVPDPKGFGLGRHFAARLGSA